MSKADVDDVTEVNWADYFDALSAEVWLETQDRNRIKPRAAAHDRASAGSSDATGAGASAAQDERGDTRPKLQ